MTRPPDETSLPATDTLRQEVGFPALEAPLDRGAAPYMRVFRRLGPAGPLALLAASLPAVTGFVITGLLTRIAPWFRAHPTEGLLVYILGFTVVGGLAILPTWAHSVLGGWAFGLRRGCPAAIASIIGGSLVGYVIGRLASGRRVVTILEEHPKTRAVYDSLLRSGSARSLFIVTLIRLPPSSPYAVTNLALAAARVNPVIYLLGTFMGIAPRTCIVVWLGSRLSHLSFKDPHWGWTLAVMVVSTMAVLSILSYFANQAIAQVTAPASPPLTSD